MTYLAIALGLLLLAQHIHYELRIDRLRAAQQRREDELLNRIQAPELAVTQTFPTEPDPVPTYLPVDDTPHADNVWDLFQEEKN